LNYSFEIENLHKHFGDFVALDNINLKAQEGTIFGLLGPNGAGKTTIVKILSTLISPDKGSKVLVHGIDVVKHPNLVRETIGLAGQYAALDEYLSGYENIYMTGRLYGLNHLQAKEKTTELLDKLHLTESARKQVKTYSGGMRRRLDLGASLVGNPKILYLDEPTTGLDPATRLDLWDIVRDLVRSGTSILLTTQYLEEADELADQIAVVNKGKVIAEGTSDQLKSSLGGDIIEFQIKDEKEYPLVLSSIQKFSKTTPSFDKSNLTVSIPVKEGSKSLMDIVGALNQAHLTVHDLSLHRPSLDDVFLSLTSNQKSKTTKELSK